MTPQQNLSEAATVVCLGLDSKILHLPEDTEKHLRLGEAREQLKELLPQASTTDIENAAHRAAETKAVLQGGDVGEWFATFKDLLLRERDCLCHPAHA